MVFMALLSGKDPVWGQLLRLVVMSLESSLIGNTFIVFLCTDTDNFEEYSSPLRKRNNNNKKRNILLFF